MHFIDDEKSYVLFKSIIAAPYAMATFTGMLFVIEAAIRQNAVNHHVLRVPETSLQSTFRFGGGLD